VEFQKEFSDEARCAAFLYARRWPDGFVCPACGKGRAAALKSRPRLFECLDCGRQTSLTAGTALHRSKLPLTTWFWAAPVMATHSNGMSARQLEDQLGVTYKTAWLVSQKLRRRKRTGPPGLSVFIANEVIPPRHRLKTKRFAGCEDSKRCPIDINLTIRIQSTRRR
jgi:transposase-like protein